MEHNKKSNMVAFLSGIVITTLAGGYFFFGSKNARKNRHMIEDWMEDAKAEVASKLKTIKNISKETYNNIVDTVSDKYAEMKDIGIEKADDLRKELKSKWKEIEKEAMEDSD